MDGAPGPDPQRRRFRRERRRNHRSPRRPSAGFHGFDPKGIPEFARARKAMQYAASIDDFARIMKDGNNGGYANNWLVADRKTNEVASLELGLKNVTLRRTKDGYFVGSNLPADPKLAKEETDFDLNDRASARTRGTRGGSSSWTRTRGGSTSRRPAFPGGPRRYVSTARSHPNERTLCGHVDAIPRGMGTWQSAACTGGRGSEQDDGRAGAAQTDATRRRSGVRAGSDSRPRSTWRSIRNSAGCARS